MLQSDCCRSQHSSFFPSDMLLSGGETNGCCAVLQPLIFTLFFMFFTEYFCFWLKGVLSTPVPLSCQPTDLCPTQAPPFATSCLTSLWFPCCFSCSHVYAPFNSHLPLSYTQTEANEEHSLLSIAMGVNKLGSDRIHLLCLDTFWMVSKFN